MFLGYLFSIFGLIFLLIQLLVSFFLLQNWLARWPIFWWSFYKHLLGGLLISLLIYLYYFDYVELHDLVLLAVGLYFYSQRHFLKTIFYFLCYFVGKFLGFWWNKVNWYNLRYYLASLNIIILDSDLFWLEIYRDQLYPNDNRYFRIYRRWVFWLSPRPFDDESKDYFYLFILGYLSRNFIIITRLAFIYGRIYLQRMIANLLGATLCHTLFFGLYFFFFFCLRKLSYVVHKVSWLTYIFMLRQFQYLGSNYVNFHLLSELNMSWAQTEVPGNYDAFDEVIFGYPYDPSGFIVKAFEHFKTWDRLGEQNGLGFLTLVSCYIRYWKYFLSLLFFLPIVLLYNFLGLVFLYGMFSYDSFSSFCRFFINKLIKGQLVLGKALQLNSRSAFLFLFIKTMAYHTLLVPVVLFKKYYSENFLRWCYHMLNGLFYMFVMASYHLVYLPALTFYLVRGTFRFIYGWRLLFFSILLILMFSDYQLHFMYIFSFGWFFSMVFSHINSFHLFHEPLYFLATISTRHESSYISTYPMEFYQTLHDYKVYVWRKISDVYRVRSAWYTMTERWIYWLYFMRFMPFYGHTSTIQKWWYNIVYYLLLRTPLLFWWTFASYNSFYGVTWFMAGVLKIFIFLPYSLLKVFTYGVFAGSRPIYKSGYYTVRFLALFLGAIKNYILWPVYVVVRYAFKILISIIVFLGNYIFFLVSKILLIWGGTTFKASWLYLLTVHWSLNDPLLINSYLWLIYIIYGDILYYLPLVGSRGFLKLTFWLELIDSYLFERVQDAYESLQESLEQWSNYSGWSFFAEMRNNSVLVKPIFFFMGAMLEAQRYLDILSINLQFPRDVHKNVYDYLVKKNLNFRFLRWIFPLRRTEMYSTARWYMPIVTYFSLMAGLSTFHEVYMYDHLGLDTLNFISEWMPSFFFGFVWSTIFTYYFLLLILIIAFPGFFYLIFNQGPTDDHINREHNWYRFLNQESAQLAWLFPGISAAQAFAPYVEITNEMSTKTIYYEKLLARSVNFKSVEDSLDNLKEDSFVELACAREDENFVVPLFLDFYVAHQYPSFRSAINKDEEKFLYFSALAYAKDEWIRTLWERTDEDDYTVIGPELLLDQVNLDQYVSFFDHWNDIQRKTDAYLFNNNLASWTFSKDPCSFSIIRTNIKEDFMDDKWARYFTKLNDEYEFEDDSDISYIPWNIWTWLLVIPLALFYKALFFLGGSHWHYNRFSSGTMQPFMLYLNTFLNHMEWAKLVIEISGDTYPNVKRESSFSGNHIMMQYKANAVHSVLSNCFYDYKLPVDSYCGEDYRWWLNFFYYRVESLSLSSLDVIRLANILSILFIVVFLPWVFTQRWNLGLRKLRKNFDFFSLTNHAFLQKWFTLRTNLKKLYLWFYR